MDKKIRVTLDNGKSKVYKIPEELSEKEAITQINNDIPAGFKAVSMNVVKEEKPFIPELKETDTNIVPDEDWGDPGDNNNYDEGLSSMWDMLDNDARAEYLMKLKGISADEAVSSVLSFPESAKQSIMTDKNNLKLAYKVGKDLLSSAGRFVGAGVDQLLNPSEASEENFAKSYSMTMDDINDDESRNALGKIGQSIVRDPLLAPMMATGGLIGNISKAGEALAGGSKLGTSLAKYIAPALAESSIYEGGDALLDYNTSDEQDIEGLGSRLLNVAGGTAGGGLLGASLSRMGRNLGNTKARSIIKNLGGTAGDIKDPELINKVMTARDLDLLDERKMMNLESKLGEARDEVLGNVLTQKETNIAPLFDNWMQKQKLIGEKATMEANAPIFEPIYRPAKNNNSLQGNKTFFNKKADEQELKNSIEQAIYDGKKAIIDEQIVDMDKQIPKSLDKIYQDQTNKNKAIKKATNKFAKDANRYDSGIVLDKDATMVRGIVANILDNMYNKGKTPAKAYSENPLLSVWNNKNAIKTSANTNQWPELKLDEVTGDVVNVSMGGEPVSLSFGNTPKDVLKQRRSIDKNINWNNSSDRVLAKDKALKFTRNFLTDQLYNDPASLGFDVKDIPANTDLQIFDKLFRQTQPIAAVRNKGEKVYSTVWTPDMLGDFFGSLGTGNIGGAVGGFKRALGGDGTKRLAISEILQQRPTTNYMKNNISQSPILSMYDNLLGSNINNLSGSDLSNDTYSAVEKLLAPENAKSYKTYFNTQRAIPTTLGISRQQLVDNLLGRGDNSEE